MNINVKMRILCVVLIIGIILVIDQKGWVA